MWWWLYWWILLVDYSTGTWNFTSQSLKISKYSRQSKFSTYLYIYVEIGRKFWSPPLFTGFSIEICRKFWSPPLFTGISIEICRRFWSPPLFTGISIEVCRRFWLPPLLISFRDWLIKFQVPVITDIPCIKKWSCDIAVLQTAEYIPLHEKEDKEVPYLPLVGNITTVTSFLFLCLLGPAKGLLYDIWVGDKHSYHSYIYFYFNMITVPNFLEDVCFMILFWIKQYIIPLGN